MSLETRNPSLTGNAAPARGGAHRAKSALERLRELIRNEVARANPVEESRRALELIVETSVRYQDTPAGLRIAVLDDQGRPRTKRTDGDEVDLTIQDLIGELRSKHPRLFAPPVREGATAVAAARTGRAAVEPPERPDRGTPKILAQSRPVVPEPGVGPEDGLALAPEPDQVEPAHEPETGTAVPLSPGASARRTDARGGLAVGAEPGRGEASSMEEPERTTAIRPSRVAAQARAAARDVLSLGSAESGPPADRLPRAARGGADLVQPGRDLSRGSAGQLGAPLDAPVATGIRGALARLRSVRVPVTWRALPVRREPGFPVPRARFGGRVALILVAFAVALPLVGVLGASLIGEATRPPPRDARATAPEAASARPREAIASGRAAGETDVPMSARPPREPAATGRAPGETDTTGTVQGQDLAPAGAAVGPLRGVAEVLDTATLLVQGKVVRLFGVEWAKGAGDPDDLASYLRSREVVCRPEGATDKHRCEVGGQDLSKVVLFNGGGRATPEASPDLKAAEEHARSQQVGVWGAESLRARP